MFKKVISFAIFIFLVVALVGCTGNTVENGDTPSLEEYKAAAKAEIESYAEARQDNCGLESLTALAGVVWNSKAAIDAAIGKDGVDMVVKDAKGAIDVAQTKDEDEMGAKPDFKDDRIIVVMKQYYSKVNGIITPDDFGIDWQKVGLGTITDLSHSNSKNSKLVDGEFFQILLIELTVKGKDKVLEAIEELLKSEIVRFAEPDYNYLINTDPPYQDLGPYQEWK